VKARATGAHSATRLLLPSVSWNPSHKTYSLALLMALRREKGVKTVLERVPVLSRTDWSCDDCNADPRDPNYDSEEEAGVTPAS
jgi:hypothetical protein